MTAPRHVAVTAASPPRVKLPDEVLELIGGPEAEAVAKEPLAQTVLTKGLAAVPLGQVRFDQPLVGALAQRLGGDCRHARLDRGGEAAGSGQLLAERIERVQPKLAEAFTLDRDPLLVPVGEEVVTEWQAVLQTLGPRRAVDQPVGQARRLAEVHRYPRREPKVPTRRLHQWEAGAPQPPEGGTEAGVSAVLGRVEPQHPCDVIPNEEPIVESEEREHALRAPRQEHRSAAEPQLERLKQRENDARGWRSPSRPPPGGRSVRRSNETCSRPHRRRSSLLVRSRGYACAWPSSSDLEAPCP